VLARRTWLHREGSCRRRAGRDCGLRWQVLVLGVGLALLALAADPTVRLTIDYPESGSIFPPDMVAPAFLWRDSAAGARFWRIDVTFADGSAALRAISKGQRPRIGEIDPRCVSESNEPPKLTPQEAASWTWKPDPETWAAIKRHSVSHPATVTITGFAGEQSEQALSRGSIAIQTSKDPVGAPIFYRDVPLMPAPTEQGVIKPLDQTKLPLINWRLRNIGESRGRLLLTGMYTCANCHSFAADGKTMGMDLDGPANDKGMYTLIPVQQKMTINTRDVIEWSTSAGKLTGEIRVGFMSQVSPDGQYVVTMIQGPGSAQKNSLNNFYTANFKDYRFLQVFYPTRGILAWYSRETGKLQPLPGADDPRYVHTNAVWAPDGKYIVFARAEARDAYPPGAKIAERANDPNETQIQYDLFRIPFNGGKGGQPERIAGASQNGMSNSFPKMSPDGRWIVFVECRNGELMRPDGKLYIVPTGGGEARRLRANTPLMNSWHSFSPNGRWLVFSSKSRGPYTKMFLTHLDQDGNSSPAILIEDATAANRAVNIPEFVNTPPDGMQKIDVPATEFYRRYNIAWELSKKGQYEAALGAWRQALEINPNEANIYMNLGVTLARLGKPVEAIAQYQKALQLAPDAVEVHFRLGSALADTGQFDQAIVHFRRVLEIRPAKDAEIYDAVTYNLMGRALAGKGEMAEALQDLETATRIHPNFAPHLYDYALALVRANRFDDAQAAVESAIAADPGMAAAHDLRGGLLARNRQLPEAANEYRRALELQPDFSRAHLDLANVLAAQGDMPAAVQQLRQAAQGGDPAVAQAANQALQQLEKR
jgi:tetratricopeptide (TPR) repeat protein